MKRKNTLLTLSMFVFLTLLAAGCNPSANPTTPPLPTADVPPLTEIDAAQQKWEAGNNQRYFVEVEEINLQGTFRYRVVVDGEVRAAQRLERVDGEWQPPEALDLETARQYTVDAIFERIRRDALGDGPVPMDMQIIFDPLSGYPSLVETRALPTYNEQGQLRMNREHSYTLGVKVDVLIEDTLGLDKQPLMTLTRSGGPQAWCDTLRIFTDGTSVYTDDCRQILLQLRPPADRFASLEEIAAAIAPLAEERQDDGIQRLSIHGAGSSPADPNTRQVAWELAAELAQLLSKPIGAGLTMLYTQNSFVIGIDLRTMLAQPTSLQASDTLYGLLVSPNNDFLAYSDSRGARWFDLSNGNDGLLLPAPPDGYYLPRGWNAAGQLVFQRISNAEGPVAWGWANLEDRSWNPLPALEAFACDSGIALNPNAAEMLIAADSTCGQNAGLTLVALDNGESRILIAPPASTQPPVVGAADPDWSPDGEWIAVSLELQAPTDEARLQRIYLLRPDGSELTALTSNTTGKAARPVWNADGTRLYYQLLGTDTGEDGIYEYDLESDTHTLLIPGSGLAPVGVSPLSEFLAFTSPEGLSVWLLTHGKVFPVAFGSDENRPVFRGWLSLGE